MDLSPQERDYLATTQRVGQEMLNALNDVCARLDVRYGIVGGTLIGALRHQGWIPWDDDIDVAMHRDDFERFRLAAPDLLPPHIRFSDIRSDPDHITVIPRLLHTGVKREPFARPRATPPPETVYVPLDIFVLDKPPAAGRATRAWLAALKLVEKMIVARNTPVRVAATDPTSSPKRRIIETVGVLVSRVRSQRGWRDAHTRLCTRYNDTATPVVAIPNDFTARYRIKSYSTPKH